VGPKIILDVVPLLPLHYITDCLSKLNSQVLQPLPLDMIMSVLNQLTSSHPVSLRSNLLLWFYLLVFFNWSLSKMFPHHNSVVFPLILVTCTDHQNHLEFTSPVILGGSFASMVTVVIYPWLAFINEVSQPKRITAFVYGVYSCQLSFLPSQGCYLKLLPVL
jgi:hypothetical protein